MKRELGMAMAVGLMGLAACTQAGSAPETYGYGPGHGPGPGMMGAYGPAAMGAFGPGGAERGWGPGFGMHPGMMGGDFALPRDLTPEQRARIADIQRDFRQKQWGAMQAMHALAWPGGRDGAFDEQAARKNFDAMAALQKQMFENSIDARRQIDALLTPQQREQLQSERRRG